jgi:acetyl esterase/lipase
MIKWNYKNMSYGPDTKQKFDIIFHQNDTHAIIFIHGGAYFSGNKSEFPSFLLDFSENNTFATIDYRVIESTNTIHMGDILSDVNNALLKINELLTANGVTIKDFILVGHSAGGHIALLYAYKYFPGKGKIKIAACISMAGPTDFTDDVGWSSMTTWGETPEERLSFLSQMGSRLTGHPFELKQNNWTKQKNYSDFKNHIMSISPINYISNAGKIPPTLLIYAKGDNQVPYSNVQRLKSVFESASSYYRLITPAGSGDNHMLGGIILKSGEPVLYNNQTWVVEAKEWIEGYLG